jgi:hypothetical protein
MVLPEVAPATRQIRRVGVVFVFRGDVPSASMGDVSRERMQRFFIAPQWPCLAPLAVGIAICRLAHLAQPHGVPKGFLA